MLCIAVVVNGCVEYMPSRLDEIMHSIESCLTSLLKIVSESACRALTALTDEMGEGMVVYHPRVLGLVTVSSTKSLLN
jgi:hypothetical protein